MKIVKFVKFNENTLSNLINNEVHFSTVYQFNDFAEIRYLAVLGITYKKNNNVFDSIIKKYLEDYDLRAELLEGIYKSPFSDPSYINNLRSKIINGAVLDANDKLVIVEYIVFSNVGIFCASDVQVFNTNAARLMFAHYADNNKGVALVYECYVPMFNIEYDNSLVGASFGESGREINWLNGIYNDMDDFIIKSDIWSYEHECRLFKNPYLHKNDDIGIKLEKVLYTHGFDKRNLKTLNEINLKIYADNLDVREIHPSQDPKKSYLVLVSDGKYKSVCEWLNHTPLPNPLPKGEGI
jgi:hypothetical protein